MQRVCSVHQVSRETFNAAPNGPSSTMATGQESGTKDARVRFRRSSSEQRSPNGLAITLPAPKVRVRGISGTALTGSKLGKMLKTYCPSIFNLVEKSLDDPKPSHESTYLENAVLDPRTLDTPRLGSSRRGSVATTATTLTTDSYATAKSSFKSFGVAGKPHSISGESGDLEMASIRDPSAFDVISELPSDIVHTIIKYLDLESFVCCFQVSKTWRAAFDHQLGWLELYNERWAPLAAHTLATSVNWRSIYQARVQIEANWTKPKVKLLEGHTDSVYCVDVDGDIAATGSRDHSIRVWNIQTQDMLSILHGHQGSVLSVAIDKNMLVSGSSDNTVMVRSRPDFKLIGVLKHHATRVLDVALTDSYILSSSKDSSVAVWSRVDLSLVLTIPEAHRGPVNALVANDDFVFTAGGDCKVHQWCLRTGTCIRTFRGHSRGLACIAADFPNNRIFTGSNDRSIRLWDIESGECLMTLVGHQQLVRSLSIAHGYLISGAYDRSVKVWDIEKGELATDIHGLHGGWIFCVHAKASCIVTTSVGNTPLIVDFGADIPKAVIRLIDGESSHQNI